MERYENGGVKAHQLALLTAVPKLVSKYNLKGNFYRRLGGVVTQSSAKAHTPVRFW